MKIEKCDVCGREVFCEYSQKRVLRFCKFECGLETELDICEQCWNGFKDFMKNRLKMEE